MEGKISASLMCANLLELHKDLEVLEQAGLDYIHFDIMDGSFVPNFTFGPDIVKAVRTATDVPFDIHFMVNSPERHIESFDIRKGDIVSVHYEASQQLQRAIDLIRSKEALIGIALNPATGIAAIEEMLSEIDMVLIMMVSPGFAGQKMVEHTLAKIARLKNLIMKKGLERVRIQVDGNVSIENALRMRQNGADIFVAGTSSIFKNGLDIKHGIAQLRSVIM